MRSQLSSFILLVFQLKTILTTITTQSTYEVPNSIKLTQFLPFVEKESETSYVGYSWEHKFKFQVKDFQSDTTELLNYPGVLTLYTLMCLDKIKINSQTFLVSLHRSKILIAKEETNSIILKGTHNFGSTFWSQAFRLKIRATSPQEFKFYALAGSQLWIGAYNTVTESLTVPWPSFNPFGDGAVANLNVHSFELIQDHIFLLQLNTLKVFLAEVEIDSEVLPSAATGTQKNFGMIAIENFIIIDAHKGIYIYLWQNPNLSFVKLQTEISSRGRNYLYYLPDEENPNNFYILRHKIIGTALDILHFDKVSQTITDHRHRLALRSFSDIHFGALSGSRCWVSNHFSIVELNLKKGTISKIVKGDISSYQMFEYQTNFRLELSNYGLLEFDASLGTWKVIMSYSQNMNRIGAISSTKDAFIAENKIFEAAPVPGAVLTQIATLPTSAKYYEAIITSKTRQEIILVLLGPGDHRYAIQRISVTTGAASPPVEATQNSNDFNLKTVSTSGNYIFITENWRTFPFFENNSLGGIVINDLFAVFATDELPDKYFLNIGGGSKTIKQATFDGSIFTDQYVYPSVGEFSKMIYQASLPNFVWFFGSKFLKLEFDSPNAEIFNNGYSSLVKVEGSNSRAFWVINQEMLLFTISLDIIQPCGLDNCELCPGGTCFACSAGFKLVSKNNRECQRDCDSFGVFYNESSQNCESCADGCLDCENGTECSLCKEGEFLKENKCQVEKCEEKIDSKEITNYKISSVEKWNFFKCASCPANCLNCEVDNSICQECITGYNLTQNLCVEIKKEKEILKKETCRQPDCNNCTSGGKTCLDHLNTTFTTGDVISHTQTYSYPVLEIISGATSIFAEAVGMSWEYILQSQALLSLIKLSEVDLGTKANLFFTKIEGSFTFTQKFPIYNSRRSSSRKVYYKIVTRIRANFGLLLRFIVYLVAWIIRLSRFWLLFSLKKKKTKFSVTKVKFISKSENFHFSLFLNSYMYIFFYSIYTLSSDLSLDWERAISLPCFLLCFADLIYFLCQSWRSQLRPISNKMCFSNNIKPQLGWEYREELSLRRLGNLNQAMEKTRLNLVSGENIIEKIYPMLFPLKNFFYINMICRLNIKFLPFISIICFISIEILYTILQIYLLFKTKIKNYILFLSNLSQSVCFAIVLSCFGIFSLTEERPLFLQNCIIYTSTAFMCMGNFLLVSAIVWTICGICKKSKKDLGSKTGLFVHKVNFNSKKESGRNEPLRSFKVEDVQSKNNSKIPAKPKKMKSKAWRKSVRASEVNF